MPRAELQALLQRHQEEQAVWTHLSTSLLHTEKAIRVAVYGHLKASVEELLEEVIDAEEVLKHQIRKLSDQVAQSLCATAGYEASRPAGSPSGSPTSPT